MNQPLIVIAAGGTGGHMFPAQALAEALLAKGWRVRLSTDERGARYTGGFPDAVEITQVASATFARGGRLAKLRVPLRIAQGVWAALRQMRRDRPAAVVGFGGYPSIPALTAAYLLRLPRMIHEQNGVLGRVNKVFAGRVQTLACGTWPTDVPDGMEGVHTGNPVRAAVLDKAAAPYAPPGEGPINLLVFGGSQGAKILSDIAPEALAGLPDDVRARVSVVQQAREEEAKAVKATYSEAGIAAEVSTFFNDIPDRIAMAQLVIARSGASTVADLSVIGRPSVLVPFAAATGDHQTANARGLSRAGGAEVIAERDLTPESLRHAVASVIFNSEKAQAMAAAALEQGRPDATEALVALVEDLIKA